VLDRTPCGSSSGSGAAVAANLAALAVGTETDGSIVCPAATCGLVGVKPTLGLVSRSGIIPIAHSQDTAGPMTRTVRDAALLLGVLASGGADPRDPLTAGAQAHAAADFTRLLDAGALRGVRVGVARNFFGFHEGVDRVMDDALRALREAGAVVVDPAPITTADKFGSTENDVLQFEFKADLNAYLASLGPRAPYKTLADLIAFNEAHRDREMPYFGQELFVRAQAKGPLTEAAYRSALAKGRRLSRTQGIDATLTRHRLDAIVAPSNGPAWPTDLANGDHFTGGSSSPAAVAGYPSITVPAGFAFGLPIGVSFTGAAWSEPTLIRLAAGFERATAARRPPRYLPTGSAAL
jgi:amidase